MLPRYLRQQSPQQVLASLWLMRRLAIWMKVPLCVQWLVDILMWWVCSWWQYSKLNHAKLETSTSGEFTKRVYTYLFKINLGVNSSIPNQVNNPFFTFFLSQVQCLWQFPIANDIVINTAMHNDSRTSDCMTRNTYLTSIFWWILQ